MLCPGCVCRNSWAQYRTRPTRHGKRNALCTRSSLLLQRLVIVLTVLSVSLPLGTRGAVPRSGLALWLSADDLDGNGRADTPAERGQLLVGGRVAEWHDRSEAALCARQATPESQPLWVAAAVAGRPVLRFDGGDFLDLGRPDTLDFQPGQPFTVVVVYQARDGDFGTFLAKGGGSVGQRACQFYINQTKVGAIVHGTSREAAAPRGANLATLVSDGATAQARVNGRRCLDVVPGRADSATDVLIGARRHGADNTGIYYGLKGDLAELLVYGRALRAAELDALHGHFAARYGLALAVTAAMDARRMAADGNALGAAELLRTEALANRLDEAGALLAGSLLEHDAPFVRSIAEWAISLKVGRENNGQAVAWPKPSPTAWFEAWRLLGPDRILEVDTVRQAVSRNLHRDHAAMLRDIRELRNRAQRMVADFTADSAQPPAGQLQTHLSALERACRAAEHTPTRAHGTTPELRQCWLQARAAIRRIALVNPALDVDRIVFVKQFAPHTVRNITRSYPWKHKPGGDVCVLTELQDAGNVAPLLKGRLGPGFVWGLDLWWSADRVVFGYAKHPDWPPTVNTANAGLEGRHAFELRREIPPMHIYEASLNGGPVRQLTDHPYWNDFEPTYCANGDVVFASDRCGRSAQCGNETYDHTNPNLFVRSAADGAVRQFTDNKDIDRYPHCLDDGTIAYTHWEYQERHFMEVHAIWTARPDGRMADALYKHHMRAPCGLRDARSIPNSRKLVAIATGHHTFAWGPVVTLDPRHGLNNPAGLRIVTPGVRVQEGKMTGTPIRGGGVRDSGGLYQTPWALSEDCFLVSYAYARPGCTASGGVDSNGFALYLIDTYGNRELLHRDQLLSCTFPIPLKPRPRPSVAAEPVPVADRRAVCIVPDVYEGMPKTERGTIRYLRISQHVGWPFDAERGAMHYLPGVAGARQPEFNSWSPVRVIGTVPVSEDGSACFRVPADTAIYFQALDAKHMEVRRMRSMVSLKPGEVRGCTGCHESQARAPAVQSTPLTATAGTAVTPEPPWWGADRLLGYEWLVQPVFDKHCVRCHGGSQPKAGLALTAGDEGGPCQSFRALFRVNAPKKGRKPALVSTANRFSGAEVSGVKQFGSHRSRLIQVLLNDAGHRKNVALSDREWLALVTWIDANAPYYDAFVDKRSRGGGKQRRDVRPELAGIGGEQQARP